MSKCLLLLMFIVICLNKVGAVDQFSVVEHDKSLTSLQVSQIADTIDQKALASDDADECCQIDCYDLGCICFENACSSVAFMTSSESCKRIENATSLILYEDISRLPATSSVLYRPPIKAS